MSIATGTPWFGRDVKQGPVFIVIGEGHSGYGGRLAAWAKATGVNIEDAPVFISTAPVQMLDEASAKYAGEIITFLSQEHGQPALVIFDTLARNFGPGDENSTADMTRFVAYLDTYIGNSFTRLLVHHTGHGDASRGRGSSVLKGAADAEYMLKVAQDKTITLSCQKMKDAIEFSPLTFKPSIVQVNDDLLNPITSVHLVETDTATRSTTEKLSPQMRQALNILDMMPGNGVEKCINCLEPWKLMCIEEGIYSRTAFYNTVKTLEERNIVEISGDYVKRK